MKKLLLLLAVLVLPVHGEAARGNKEKLATPVFQDQTNESAAFSVNVGTYNSIRLYAPVDAQQKSREDRGLLIQNASPTRKLHLTTWTVTEATILNSTVSTTPSFIVQPSSSIYSNLVLSPGTTWYGRFERGGAGNIADALTGASSDTVRGLVHRFNQSLVP